MLSIFALGIIVGNLLSLIAVIVGKRLEVRINSQPTTQPRNTVKKAVIIKKETDEFMDEINDNQALR